MRNYGERDEALIPRGNSSGGAFVTVFLVLQDLIKLALRTTLKSTASRLSFFTGSKLQVSISLTAARDVTFDYFKTCPKGSSQFFCLKSKNEKSKKKNLIEINDYVKKAH